MTQMDFIRFFCEKYAVKHVMEACESWMPCFLCRSLLLSTTILNDKNRYVLALRKDLAW